MNKLKWLENEGFSLAREITGWSITGCVDGYWCYFEHEEEDKVIDFAFLKLFDDLSPKNETV